MGKKGRPSRKKVIRGLKALRLIKGRGVKTRANRDRRQKSITPADVAAAMRLINHINKRRQRNISRSSSFIDEPAVPAATAAAATAALSSRRRRRESPADYMAMSPSSSDSEDEISFPSALAAPMVDVGDGSRFDIPKTLTDDPYAPAMHAQQSNFYIMPKEAIRYLEDHTELFEGDRLNLDAVARMFQNIETSSKPYIPYWRGDRNDPNFDNDEFIENEIRMMHPLPHDMRNRNWAYPYLQGFTGTYLSIPGRDVMDLPLFVMLYILKRLTQFPRGTRSFLIAYNLGPTESNVMIPIKDDEGRPIAVIDGRLREKDLEQIYMTIIRHYAAIIPDNESGASWNGSEESGTRIILANMKTPFRLKLKLDFSDAHVNSTTTGWTQGVEDLLNNTVGNAVISVRNKDDNKCLIYCLVMGLILKMTDTGSRAFGASTMMVDPAEVYSKGMFLFTDESNEVTCLIHKLTRLLMPPDYSDGPLDPLTQYVVDIDKRVGTMQSVSEFREEFSDLEEKLIPNHICGIDIYGIDYNVNMHIYPLYISKYREKTIDLLCVTPADTRCSHYCVITNMEKLLRDSGGKQFFSCSRCGQTFYHRRLVREHKCPAVPDHYQVDGDGGYHYSRMGVDPRCDIICGACSKCRLCFVDDFALEYHKTHCLMEGQTGYRHVQLITYKQDEHPTLKGEEIDLEAEDGHVKRRRVMYADFECSIDPETGVHSFMSYGVYEWKSGVYKCGYSLEEFVNFIVNVAYANEEDQIYVYFHNAMGYDANFILRHVLRNPAYRSWGIQVIMKSSNKLQKLVLHTHKDGKSRAIHIGDTFLFLTLSLERIVGSIRKDEIEINTENFPRFFYIFSKRYPDVPIEMIDHVLRKNIFPYKFFTDASKLNTTIDEFLKIFEPKEENLKYFSERVTVDELRDGYEDTKRVVDTYKCKDARDYHDLYLCCDVMQLADVFDRSMNILWESHNIHLTKYLGMPSASWAAFLRHDPSMSIPLYEETFYAEFFKAMIRGGITSAALRHAVADDKHSIIYLDVNGLYPYVMQKYDFPCGRFSFVPMGWAGEMVPIKLEEKFAMLEREHKGMCFCVDMHFPDEVKELTDMYPFAPEHRRIFREYYSDVDSKELTPFLKRWSEANNGEKISEFKGLVCTLYDKTKYNVHWRLLKFYMEHGVIITKVWFGVMFDEGDYLAGYIRKNIAIRNERKDELGKTLYKLLGNSIYGKTFESPFKRNTYEIVRDPIKLQGLLEEGNIASMVPIDELGWIVRMDGEDIILDKPTYIGACVCEFAKLHMYTLMYDKLMSIFPNVDGERGCQLVYTDTDSFIVLVRHPPDLTGCTPQQLFAYIKSKDPTLIGGIGGQVKSETGEDDTIREIIALRSKTYAYVTWGGHSDERAKGTPIDVQKSQLNWEAYQHVLEVLTSFDVTTHNIERNVFVLSSKEAVRRSLSANDGKRYICEDGIHTHAFGYLKEH